MAPPLADAELELSREYVMAAPMLQSSAPPFGAAAPLQFVAAIVTLAAATACRRSCSVQPGTRAAR